MTSERLVTALGRHDARRRPRRSCSSYRIEKLPLVDDDGRLAGLITVKDIQKRQEFPNASRDDAGRLRCAAAVGVGDDVEERVEALVAPGVDAVTIDTAHGHSAGVIKAIERIKASWPDLPVIAGNVVTEEGVEALADAGADAVKVGVGAGSICTTRVISGAGMPQLSAIWHTTRRARQLRRPGHRRRRHHVLRRHRQGDRRRRRDGDARLAARRHRGEPGRDGAVRGAPLQELPRHGLDGRHAGPRRRPLRQRPVDASAAASRKLVPEGIEGRVAYAGAARRGRLPARRRPAQRHGLRRRRRRSRRCAPAPASCGSRRPAARRATRTTSRSPTRRPTTSAADPVRRRRTAPAPCGSRPCRSGRAARRRRSATPWAACSSTGDRARRRSPSSAVVARPGLSDTTPTTRCPKRSSGTPNTRASSTAGWTLSASSTSSGNTFSPPVLMQFEPRPNSTSVPSAAIVAMSPGNE